VGGRGSSFTVWSAPSGPVWESASASKGLPSSAFGWGDHLYEREDGGPVIGRAAIQADADGKNAEGYLHIKGEGHIFLDNGSLHFDPSDKLHGSFEISGGTHDFAGTSGGTVKLSTRNPKRWVVSLGP